MDTSIGSIAHGSRHRVAVTFEAHAVLGRRHDGHGAMLPGLPLDLAARQRR